MIGSGVDRRHGCWLKNGKATQKIFARCVADSANLTALLDDMRKQPAFDPSRFPIMRLIKKCDQIMNHWDTPDRSRCERRNDVADRTHVEHSGIFPQPSKNTEMPKQSAAGNLENFCTAAFPFRRNITVCHQHDVCAPTEKFAHKSVRPLTLAGPLRPAGFANVDGDC